MDGDVLANYATHAGLGGNGGEECAAGDVLVEHVDGVECPFCVWEFRTAGGVVGGVTEPGGMEGFKN